LENSGSSAFIKRFTDVC